MQQNLLRFNSQFDILYICYIIFGKSCMTTQMIIRLDPETKTKLTKLAQAEGKNTSQVVRELIEDYIQNRDIASYIDDLWDRVGSRLKARNVGSREIERAITDSRKSR